MKENFKGPSLELRFLTGDPLQLERSYFHFPGNEPIEKSFLGAEKGLKWDKNAMSLCYWLIKYHLSKHIAGIYAVPDDGKTDLFDTFLNLLDTPRYYFKGVLGTQQDEPLWNLIFSQPNPRKYRKAKIDSRLLPPEGIVVFRGNNLVKAEAELQKVLQEIEQAFEQQPSRKRQKSGTSNGNAVAGVSKREVPKSADASPQVPSNGTIGYCPLPPRQKSPTVSHSTSEPDAKKVVPLPEDDASPEGIKKLLLAEEKRRITGEMAGAKFATLHPEYNKMVRQFDFALEIFEEDYAHGRPTEQVEDSLRGFIAFISTEGGNPIPFADLHKEYGDDCDRWEWWDGFIRGMRDEYRSG